MSTYNLVMEAVDSDVFKKEGPKEALLQVRSFDVVDIVSYKIVNVYLV